MAPSKKLKLINFLYNILINCAQFILGIVALWSPKMKLFVSGRKETFQILSSKLNASDKVIWFHVASLGEYEQAVPIIREVKTRVSEVKILVTFFSPSGYEVKKKSAVADVVTYLPLDTPKKVTRFLDVAQPEMAIFIKYEIWPNYLKALQQRQTPTILASALFRESQIYFSWFGGFMRNALNRFDHIFVQDAASIQLLKSIGIHKASKSGDTRFDRVSHQIEQHNHLDFIDAFVGDSLCIVCGSTWPDDDAILVEYINKVTISTTRNVKFIIAPHQIKKEKISALESKLGCKTIRYSGKENKTLTDYDVFIIDTVGLLTKIYSYADIAYVGGAMGTSGLHNILEPATFGVPIVIGKNFEKFPEAIRLQQLAGLYSVSNSDDVDILFEKLITDTDFRDKTGQIAEHFINSNTGATQIISDFIITTIKQ